MGDKGNLRVVQRASLGTVIAWWREVAGLSRSEFARKLGCSGGTISHYEKDRNEPSIARLTQMARITGAGTLAGFLSVRIPRNFRPRARVVPMGPRAAVR